MDNENAHAVIEELPMENIISKDNIYNGQVHAPVRENTKHKTTSTVTRGSCKESKSKLLIMIITIVLIVLLLSIICVFTIYMLQELSRIKSEIASANIVLSQLIDNRSASLFTSECFP